MAVTTPFTGPESLQIVLGRDLVAQEPNDEWAAAELYIERASAIIRSRLPTIDVDITAGRIAATLVAHVCEQMVKRALIARTHADGVASRSEVMVNWTETVRYDGDACLELTDEDLAILVPPLASSRQKVGTVRVSPPCW